MRARALDLLVVGRGAPERGGIPSYLEWLTGRAHTAGLAARLLNITPSRSSTEGVNLANLTRTGGDVWRVFRASRQARVCNLHSAGAPAQSLIRLGLLTLAARAAGARVVIHVHGGRLPLWANSRSRLLLVRLVAVAAGHVVTVSHSGQQTLERAGVGGRSTFVPNGVDLTVFHPRPGPGGDRTPVLFFVGGMTERKGVLDLLAAATELRDRGIDFELRLVGGRPNEGDAAYRTVQDALPSWVRVLGPREPHELPELYRQADVFCLPSWWEAMPLSVLEAMASGLPVVATSVGEVPQVVLDGETGVLVPPRDRAALAAALDGFLGDAGRRGRAGQAGRQRAQAFDAEFTWARVRGILDQAAGR